MVQSHSFRGMGRDGATSLVSRDGGTEKLYRFSTVTCPSLEQISKNMVHLCLKISVQMRVNEEGGVKDLQLTFLRLVLHRLKDN